ncbi:MAG: endonuclease YncB(thermonuclease family) [Gammaproteobacteria bacterium]|jgi:endonuclease YncB( thermonuclease family)
MSAACSSSTRHERRRTHMSTKVLRLCSAIDCSSIRLVCVVFALFQTCGVGAEELSGIAHVLDGDSLRVGKTEMRLHGIDAPESRQLCTIGTEQWACGQSATRALREILGSSAVRCVWTKRDHYGRAIATCFKDGVLVNSKMVATGMALAYAKYSKRYVADELLARKHRRGIWRSTFIEPWKWRRAHPRARS